jgi:hypothetical protein
MPWMATAKRSDLDRMPWEKDHDVRTAYESAKHRQTEDEP